MEHGLGKLGLPLDCRSWRLLPGLAPVCVFTSGWLNELRLTLPLSYPENGVHVTSNACSAPQLEPGLDGRVGLRLHEGLRKYSHYWLLERNSGKK